MNDKIAEALESDAPLTAAKHQRDVGEEVADLHDWHEAALVGRTVSINRPRAEVFAFFRDFTNLPKFMANVESVTMTGDGLSHWKVKAPAGQSVEWDSRITEEVEDALIAWESVDGGDIRHAGRIEFRDGAPGRGCEVSATILYDPPAGDIGKLVAKLFQKEPKVQARQDLRRFKQLMETGEVSTSKAPEAAPRA